MYEQLYEEIILLAIYDYAYAQRRLHRASYQEHINIKVARRNVERLEKFFRSEWYHELSGGRGGEKIIKLVTEDTELWKVTGESQLIRTHGGVYEKVSTKGRKDKIQGEDERLLCGGNHAIRRSNQNDRGKRL